jgi:hypothetical protein
VAVVRFSRDKRGYEHLYLLDTSREHSRPRVLYWFRTPPGIKVGRPPFDPATQRFLEKYNPDVPFDWPEITAAKPPPVAPVEQWREKRRVERALKRARAAAAVDAGDSSGFEASEGGESHVDELTESAVSREGAPETPQPEAASGTPRQGRRRRRRRRRGTTSPGSAENGPLDPSGTPRDPSNDGEPPAA